MAWSTAINEGFLLAATVAGDRHAQVGRGMLDATAEEAFAAWYGDVNAATPDQRRQRISTITARMHAPLVATSHTRAMSRRALALLAPLAHHEVGQTWLAQSPPPRPGYRAEAGLRQVLRTIAERGSWHA